MSCTPKALQPTAWGQPRSGATPGMSGVQSTLKGLHKLIEQCASCGILSGFVLIVDDVLGWRRFAADPRL